MVTASNPAGGSTQYRISPKSTVRATDERNQHLHLRPVRQLRRRHRAGPERFGEAGPRRWVTTPISNAIEHEYLGEVATTCDPQQASTPPGYVAAGWCATHNQNLRTTFASNIATQLRISDFFYDPAGNG